MNTNIPLIKFKHFHTFNRIYTFGTCIETIKEHDKQVKILKTHFTIYQKNISRLPYDKRHFNYATEFRINQKPIKIDISNLNYPTFNQLITISLLSIIIYLKEHNFNLWDTEITNIKTQNRILSDLAYFYEKCSNRVKDELYTAFLKENVSILIDKKF